MEEVMGCTYGNFNGECTLYDSDNITGSPRGCTHKDSLGYCMVEDDPDPSVSCDEYESDGNDEDEEW